MGQPERAGGEPDRAVRIPEPSRQRRSRPRHSVARGRLRALYFSLAAAWGFLAGSGAVLVGLSATGRPAGLGAPAVGVLVGAAILALLGALVAAAGYRVASRRLR